MIENNNNTSYGLGSMTATTTDTGMAFPHGNRIIGDLLLIGKFMGVDNLFPFYVRPKIDKPSYIIGVYIGLDKEGTFDSKRPPNWFEPNIDYNQLMRVVDKIESLGYISTIEKMTGCYTQHRVWFNDQESLLEIAHGSRSEDKKEAIYEAVLDFIKWYNTNKLST